MSGHERGASREPRDTESAITTACVPVERVCGVLAHFSQPMALPSLSRLALREHALAHTGAGEKKRGREDEDEDGAGAGGCDDVIRILNEQYQRERSNKRCGSDHTLTNALKEEVRKDWTLSSAIQHITGDNTYQGFMEYVRSSDSSNVTVADWGNAESIKDLHPLVYARILRALDTAPITGDERFWLFRGSNGDFNNTLFSATTSVHVALEYVTRNGLQEDAVLQVYKINTTLGHKFLHLHEVSEYGESECEVLVHGEFEKLCELRWAPPNKRYSVRVCLYK